MMGYIKKNVLKTVKKVLFFFFFFILYEASQLTEHSGETQIMIQNGMVTLEGVKHS